MEGERGQYEVGYGRPPREHQFPKGVSGNPAGRRARKKPSGPQRSFNPYLEAVLTEMDRPIGNREGGAVVELGIFQAVVRSILASGLRGNFRAQKLATELYARAQEARLRDMSMQVRSVESYKETWPMRAREAARCGKQPPLPHPDHYNFSIERGVLDVTGPINYGQQEVWDELKSMLRRLEGDLAESVAYAAEDPQDESRKKWVRMARRDMKKAEAMVPQGWNWREELKYPEVFRRA